MALDFEGLIGKSLYEYTKNIVNNRSSEELTFFINQNIGLNYLDRYSYQNNTYIKSNKEIRLNSIKYSNKDIDFIRETFRKIDNLIDLDFTEMSHDNGSIIDIYYVSSSSLMTSNSIGMALQQVSQNGSWWEIFWKDSKNSESTSNADKNTIVHEIGHSLGLSHPFESPFNPLWDSDDTVMSYNEGSSGWSTWYTNSDIQALQKMWGREDDTGEIFIDGLRSNYKFKKTNPNKYEVRTEIGLENITDIHSIKFKDRNINIQDDVIAVFDLITGLEDYSSKIYRLYNAAFNRFPDIEGFNYWLKMQRTKENTYMQTAESFINSYEFNTLYGNNISNYEYLDKLYINILGRSSDQEGLNYWLNQLKSGNETRGEVLMGFAESSENKVLFSQEVGL